ncbi:MAG TPA: hypothetical protein VF070_13175 [Streptosporangiaceae bacterium]
MLRRGIDRGCLGDYDGSRQRTPDSPLLLAVRDIFATPSLKPADIRLILAEASGEKIPDDYTSLVRLGMRIGIGRTQAQEAAKRWCS